MLLWGGQVTSTLGKATTSVVYPLLILALTNSPVAAGIAGALRSIPYLIFSLPFGALIDRWDRKRVMILCDIGRGVAVLSIPITLAFDVLTVWQIYAVALIEGILFVLFNIAEVAALPRVVPQKQLSQAAGQNEAAYGVAIAVGPSLGTFLYQTLGRGAPFVVDAACYFISVVTLLFIKIPFHTNRVVAKRKLRAEIAEGVRWLWNRPLIRYLAFLTGGQNMVIAAMPLILIVLATELGAGAAQIGLVFSIGGVGGIVGSVIAGRIARRFSFGQVMVSTIWGGALLVPLCAVAPSPLSLGVVFGFLYMLYSIYSVVQLSYRLALIPDELQGRVNSSFRLVGFGFDPIGALLSGFVIEHFGVVQAVVILFLWFAFLATLTTFQRDVRNAAPMNSSTLR